MPEGTKYTLQPGEIYHNQTTGTFTSQTIEPEMNETGKLEMASLILERMGVNIREETIIQEATKEQQSGV
jgi:hypothetical protein